MKALMMTESVHSFLPYSDKDFPTYVAGVIFFYECNLRCPFCHNANLVIPKEKIPMSFDDLREKLDQADGIAGVVLTGGEPLLSHDLPAVIDYLNERNLLVKLDTNGFNYSKLKDLNGIDYIAMDFKQPHFYQESDIIGITSDISQRVNRRHSYYNTMRHARDNDITLELRTTAVPGIHSAAILDQMARDVKLWQKEFNFTWYIQKFYPGECLNPEFNSLQETSEVYIQERIAILKKQYNIDIKARL